jgi:dTDP-4-dehydrorhamnose 3,5-epimerase
MNIITTPLPGLLVIEPDVFNDDRGYFLETYRFGRYADAGINTQFIQDNESKSSKGVLRGLHYQLDPFAQAKLVRVVEGTVLDIAVDIRKGSPTFGRWYGIELSGKNKKQLFVPRGFAHGFSVLSETAIFTYKCDNVYNKAAERAINPIDSELGIDWKLKGVEQIISEKDREAPLFKSAEMNFVF